MKLYSIALLALALGAQTAGAQSLKLDADDTKAPYIMTSKDTVEVAYNVGFSTVAVLANTSYTVTADEATDWLDYKIEPNGSLTVLPKYNYNPIGTRTGTLSLTSADGSFTRQLVVVQQPNTSAEKMGDTKRVIASGKADSEQSGEGIAFSFDDDPSTIWHSSWGGCTMPTNVQYTFKEPGHVDYMIYTPRTNSQNGRWGEITVYYATKDAPKKFIKVTDADCGMSSASTRVSFGEQGIDDVYVVKIEIKTAGSDSQRNYASCAEIGFYENNPALAEAISNVFTSSLCNELKPGIDAQAVSQIAHPYLRMLAQNLLGGGYSTEFRVGEFGCYKTRGTLQRELCTNMGYDPYENPTGIYFNQGDKVVVFAEGIDDNFPVQLCIANFSNINDIETEGQRSSYYALRNGANLITAGNRGNGYVSYYNDNFSAAPKVKLHFAMATETGYFDAARHNDDDYKRLLANAKSDIFDILSKRLHVAAPIANLKARTPLKGEKLAMLYDSLIYREREIMGLTQAGIEPTNHQFARPVKSGMFADGNGAAAAFGSFNEWVDADKFGFWGMAHELGHINQITPGFKWSGCGETTNNIYSAWVEHKLGAANAYGDGYHRLEDEISGVGEYGWTRGGRFEAYLEEGVRKGISWQLQDGPDYHGSDFNNATVTDQDENGKSLGQITTKTRNFDHFVKVVPFWQITLWTEEVGANPGSMGRLIGSYREGFDQTKFNTNGKQQVEMMRRLCEATGYNLLPFLEKAGLNRPIKAYIEDYSPGWNIITQAMLDELKADVEAKGYKEAPAALNYINAYNWTRFRDKVALTDAGLNQGCTAQGGDRVKVDNDVWNGAVGYETYNSKNELVRITMFGLGDNQKSSRYTQVLFPSSEDASYIMAVGYDGTKVKCYAK